jgi:hypothetical protein
MDAWPDRASRCQAGSRSLAIGGFVWLAKTYIDKASQDDVTFQSPSFPRRRESSDSRLDVQSESRWVPAFAGTTSIRLRARMRLCL